MTKSMLKSLKNSNTVMVPSSNFCNENRTRWDEAKPEMLPSVMVLENVLKYLLHIAGVVLKLGFKKTLFEGWRERNRVRK